MNLSQVLYTLLTQLKLSGDNVVISWASVQQWQTNVLTALLDNKLIKVISAAQSIECQGCENACFMDVISHQVNDKQRSYIVCDDSEKQTQMGRIEIPLETLSQWQITNHQLALVISRLLAMKIALSYSKDNTVINLGMLTSDSGRKWLKLNTKPLSLEVNQHSLAIEEVLFMDGEQLVIDKERIIYALNNNPSPEDIVKPKISKREQQQAATLARYKTWQDEYKSLKKQNPNQNDSWISRKIALMSIANGASSETIRKNMK
jgi:hypothetical protein